MKKIKFIFMSALSLTILAACSSDDDNPPPVNEEEVITTMTVTMIPSGGGTTVVLESRDLDGDGPNPPEVTVSGPLSADTTYNSSIVLLNETETPPEDITEEVEEEDDEHEFFFVITGSLDATTSNLNTDRNGNPLGTEFDLEAGAASAGTLTITLIHEGDKPNDGTPEGAGGETDIAQSFPLTIQ